MARPENQLAEVSEVNDGYIRVVTSDGNSRVLKFTSLRAALGVQGAVQPWDASVGINPPTPDPTETAPWYRVTKAGMVPAVGPVEEGDNIYWEAATRSWFKIDNTEKFISINGYTEGAVELDTDDVDEGDDNLYFTDERAQKALREVENIFTAPQIFESTIEQGNISWRGVVNGNFCSAVNAHFDGEKWVRYDDTKPAWLQQHNIATNISNRGHKGLTLWRCGPGSGAIGFETEGGWQLTTSLSDRGGFTLGGDSFIRLQSVIYDDMMYAGMSVNFDLNYDERDEEDKDGHFAGFVNDDFKVKRAPAGEDWVENLGLDKHGNLLVRGHLGQKSPNNENPEISQVMVTDGDDVVRKSSIEHVMKSGATHLDTDDIKEGSGNKYFTDERARQAVTGGEDAWHRGNLDPDDYVEKSQKGAPDGVATLEGGQIPIEQIPTSVRGKLEHKGVWNAYTNTPTLPTTPSPSQKGDFWVVSVAGDFAGESWDVGDWIVSNGSGWDKVSNSGAVKSVHGRTGDVVAQEGDYTTSEVTEGTRLYFTEGRVRSVKLIGLTLDSSADVTTDDDIETAIGKLQTKFNNLGEVASRNIATTIEARAGTGEGLMTPPLVHEALNRFGVAGADLEVVTTTLDDLDQNMVVFASGSPSSPDGTDGYCRHLQHGPNTAHQEYITVGGEKYKRTKIDGEWQTWEVESPEGGYAALNLHNHFQQGQTFNNSKQISWMSVGEEEFPVPLLQFTDENLFVVGDEDFDVELRGVENNVAGNFSVAGDAVFHGSLHVKGEVTIIDSTEVNIGDNIVRLNANHTGVPVLNAGIEIERGTSANVSLLWDETHDRWTVGSESIAAGHFIGDGSQLTNVLWENLTNIPESATRGEISTANITNPTSSSLGFISGRRFIDAVTAWWNNSSIKTTFDSLKGMAFLDKATQAQQLAGLSDSVGTTPLGVSRYVEQFGLGTSIIPVLPDGNADTLAKTGFYRTSTSWVGSPTAGSQYNQGTLLHIGWGGPNAVQIFRPIQRHEELIRYNDNGVWSDWARMWSSADFSQSSIDNWNTAYGWGDYRQFGLGTAGAVQPEVTNVDEAKTSGLFRIPPSATGHPWPNISSGLWVVASSGSYVEHIAVKGGNNISNGSMELAFRHFNGTEWSDWQYTWHSGNLSQSSINNWNTAHNKTANVQSATPENGGLLVDNKKTGAGLERVLTESDLGSGEFHLGNKPSDPTTDNDGGPLVQGMIYYNTTENELRVWNGSEWESTATGSAINSFDEFFAGTDFTEGVTTQFTLSERLVSAKNALVFFDAAWQPPSFYTIDGTTLTLNEPVPVGVQRVFVVGRVATAPGVISSENVEYNGALSSSNVKEALNEVASRSRKNYLINGCFRVWQRGDGPFENTSYSADRWRTWGGEGGTYAAFRVPTALGSLPFTDFLKVTTPDDGVSTPRAYQRIEGVSTLQGRKATVSLFLRANAPSQVEILLTQNFGSGGSPSSTVKTPSVILEVGTSFQRYSATFDVPSILGKTLGSNGDDFLELVIACLDTGGRELHIGQVQLEEGPVATDFEYRPIGEELALCQRYFQTHYTGEQAINVTLDANKRYFVIPFPCTTPMRVRPSVTAESLETRYTDPGESEVTDRTADIENIRVTGTEWGSIRIVMKTWNLTQKGWIRLRAQLDAEL